MKQDQVIEQKTSMGSYILAIIALGSICGLIEVVAGGYLKQAGFPYRAGLLIGLGFALVALGMAIFRKPIMAVYLGLIAALSKQLAVVILHLPALCMANSTLAVILEYGALAAIATAAFGTTQKSLRSRIIVGGASGFVGSLAFYFIGMQVAPCNYLLSFNSSAGFVSYLYQESVSWALFPLVFFPLGWFVGVKISEKSLTFLNSKPQFYYAGTLITTAICWISCAIAIINGI